MVGRVSTDVRAPVYEASGRYLAVSAATREALARARQMREQARRMREEARNTRAQVRELRQLRQRDLEGGAASGPLGFPAVLEGFDLCSPPLKACAHGLGLDGLALLVGPGSGSPEVVHCSGVLARALEDLQWVQGQGPGRDAARDGHVVLVPDASTPASSHWPGLSCPVEALGVRAVFAFPLVLGEVSIGALVGHRRTPGIMDADQLGNAVTLADTVALTATRSSDWLLELEDLPFGHVHQAVGRLTERLGVSPESALLRLRAHAFRHGRTLLGTARAVLRGELGLDDDTDPWPPGVL
ncbi:ANTAR domain-containing protein [Streptomyces sp. CA-132043]|uniref:GAF and ANTAR domain-containing protein n=1 Tax=Streptomyces sp. CA-132043 TaxID=3240048 RepID=UPI003D8ADA8F